jgi:hypothetical protein
LKNKIIENAIPRSEYFSGSPNLESQEGIASFLLHVGHDSIMVLQVAAQPWLTVLAMLLRSRKLTLRAAHQEQPSRRVVLPTPGRVRCELPRHLPHTPDSLRLPLRARSDHDLHRRPRGVAEDQRRASDALDLRGRHGPGLCL